MNSQLFSHRPAAYILTIQNRANGRPATSCSTEKDEADGKWETETDNVT